MELLGVKISDENVSRLQRSLRNLGPISFIALGRHTISLDESVFSLIVSASNVANAHICYSAITDDGIRATWQWKGLQIIELQKNSQISLDEQELQATLPGVRVYVTS